MRIYALGGLLSGGLCSGGCPFDYTDVPCPSGCSAGQCNGSCSDEVSSVMFMLPGRAGDILSEPGALHLLLDSDTTGTHYLLRTQNQWQHTEVMPYQFPSFYSPQVALARAANGVLHGLSVQWQSIRYLTQLQDTSWQQHSAAALFYTDYEISNLTAAANGSLHFGYQRYYDMPTDSFPGAWDYYQVEVSPGGTSLSYDHLLNSADPIYQFTDTQSHIHAVLRDYPFIQHWMRVNGSWQLLASAPIPLGAVGATAAVDSQYGLHVIYPDNGQPTHIYNAASSSDFVTLAAPPALGPMDFDAQDNLYVVTQGQLWRRTAQGQWGSISMAGPATGPYSIDVDPDGTVHVLGWNLHTVEYARICPW